MFGKKRKLRKDLPAIDLRKKPVKGLFGQTKLVATTKKEQRTIKKKLMEHYPDRYYIGPTERQKSSLKALIILQ